jgi:transposase
MLELQKKRTAMSEIQAYVGLDVHKDTISVAVAEAGREGEVKSWGAIPHETMLIDQSSGEVWLL